jgi:predicted transposase/invertase (TIGR01784 family)
MEALLTPKLDYVFKKLFTLDVDLLIDLINSVLTLIENNQIISIDIKNPEILPDHIKEKYIVLDIKAYDNLGNHYDIEMQASKYLYYPKRSTYYLSKLFASQLKSGENYQLLEPVIGIHFLDYIVYPRYPDYSYCFELRDYNHPELKYSDDLSLYIFELPKVSSKKKTNVLLKNKSKQIEWLNFLNNAHEGGSAMQKAYYTNPMVHRAFDLLSQISADEQTRKEAEFREMAIRNKIFELNAAEEEGIKKGIKKGREEGRLEEILNGISLGLDLKFGKSGLKLLPEISKIKQFKTLLDIHNGIRSSDSVEQLRQIYTIRQTP